MKTKLTVKLTSLALLAGANWAAAQGTAFTYQGQLQNNGSPATGTYNLTFSLFNTNTGGTALAGPVTNNAVSIINGLFKVTVDFGAGVFTGATHWLQIGVATNGSTSFSDLTPRQQVTPTPYSIYSENAGSLSGLLVQANTNGAPDLIGGSSVNFVPGGVNGATISGGGAVFYNGTSYTNSVTGDFGSVGGGAGNTASFNAAVGGGFGNTASGAEGTVGGGAFNTAGVYATVGGGFGNVASGGGSFVGGGGFDGTTNYFGNTASGGAAVVGGGLGNQASAQFAMEGGGRGNQASGFASTVAGGDGNSATLDDTTVSGGWGNSASGPDAVISGGDQNNASGYGTVVAGGEQNGAGGDFSTVGGGTGNNAGGAGDTLAGGFNNSSGGGNNSTISGGKNNNSSGSEAVIGGGQGNSVSDFYTTISGGINNTATNLCSVVCGGTNNLSGGYAATVAGGSDNAALGDYSFAAGNFAQATDNNSFVWSDGSTNTLSTTNMQFVARAANGFIFYSSAGAEGVSLAPGSGSWSSMSDRHAKDDFAPLNPQAVLAGVAALPLTTWSYKTEPGVRHVGPMAQDFYAAFKVGPDDRHITTIDEGGVALAAIQGLNQELEETRAENARLKQQNDSLAERLNALEAAVKRFGANK